MFSFNSEQKLLQFDIITYRKSSMRDRRAQKRQNKIHHIKTSSDYAC